MQVKFADETTLNAVNAAAGGATLEGAYRDVMTLEFDGEEVSFETLRELGCDAGKLETITLVTEEGEYPYQGYVLFGGLALDASGRFHLKIGQQLSQRESELMAQAQQAQEALEILVNGEVTA